MDRLRQTLAVLLSQPQNSAILPPLELAPVCQDCYDLGVVCATHPEIHGEELPLHSQGRDCRWAPCHCVRERQAAEHAEHLRTWCELPKPMQVMTFESLKPRPKATGWAEALKFAQAYAQGKTPQKWVRFWGPPGTGKTHLAVAIVSYRLTQDQFAKYVHVGDWLAALKATFDHYQGREDILSTDQTYEQVWSDYANAPLLLLDDLGAQQRTAWSDGELDRLMDHRYRLALETVVTTNAADGQMLGLRVSDRLQDKGLCKGLHLQGPSYRPENERIR